MLHGFGNVIDDTFHCKFKELFAPIFGKEAYTENQKLDNQLRRDLGYYRGPTKGHARMSEKVREYWAEFQEEKQHDKRFPHAACVIDVTRCSVALADPADRMEAFRLLTSQESQDGLG